MRAIVDATGYRQALQPVIEHRPSPLLNVGDQPLLFHILGKLAEAGYTDVELILHHLPEMIEQEVRQGERWGLHITTHLVRYMVYPYDTIRISAKTWGESPVLLARGDVLPNVSLQPTQNAQPLLYMEAEDHWTGWGFVSSKDIGAISRGQTCEQLVENWSSRGSVQPCAIELSSRSFPELLHSNRLICQDSKKHQFPSSAKEVEPGVWISRGTVIHPSAKLVPPVFLGEETHINDSCTIGPNTVVENHCVIDEDSHIENSVVSQHSYVGKHLEIKDSIVDRNLLVNIAHGTQIQIKDDFILSDLVARKTKYQSMLRGVERTCAGLCLLVASPYLLYQLIRRQPEFKTVVDLPAETDNEDWNTFDWMSFHEKTRVEYGKRNTLRERLIGLFHIWRGEAHFVGLPPRTYNEVQELPPDWRSLYLNAKVGLITLADLNPYEHIPPDELYSTEAYYTTQRGPLFDIRIAWRALLTRLRGVET